MAQTVVGLFDTQNQAQEAADALLSSGFSDSMVDLSKGGAFDTTENSTVGDPAQSGVGKFFSSLFGSNENDVSTYSDVAKRSGAIVTVHAGTAEEAQRAAQLMDAHGAIDVDAIADQMKSTNTPAGNTNDLKANEDLTISVIEEELQVGKRVVETGGARIRSRIVERPVEESVRLREERVTVSRNPVNRPATESDFRESSIESTETAEVPVVSKEARVIEEVTLNKEVSEREEIIKDTVRSTEVDVENLNKTGGQTKNTASGKDLL